MGGATHRRGAAYPLASPPRVGAQPRRGGHGLLSAGRSSLRPVRGHADLALPRPGARARRRVRRSRPVVGGLPTRGRGSHRALTDARPLLERDPVGRYSRRIHRSACSASLRCSASFATPRPSTTACSTPGWPTCWHWPGEPSWTAPMSWPTARSPRGRRRGTSPAGRPRRRRPGRPGTQGWAELPTPEPALRRSHGRLHDPLPQPATSRPLHAPLRPGPQHHSARGCPPSRVWQLRTVPPGVPQGDRPPPLRPPHLSQRRRHLTAQWIDRAGAVRLTPSSVPQRRLCASRG